MAYSNSKKTYYRRLYVAYLIDNKINTVPAIVAATGMHTRTVQETIALLSAYDITCKYKGSRKNGHYVITHWAAIKKTWIKNNLLHIKDVLEFL
ncbi:MAG: helix-turn-helix domain-containing protein [Pseudomonadota bacterium]